MQTGPSAPPAYTPLPQCSINPNAPLPPVLPWPHIPLIPMLHWPQYSPDTYVPLPPVLHRTTVHYPTAPLTPHSIGPIAPLTPVLHWPQWSISPSAPLAPYSTAPSAALPPVQVSHWRTPLGRRSGISLDPLRGAALAPPTHTPPHVGVPAAPTLKKSSWWMTQQLGSALTILLVSVVLPPLVTLKEKRTRCGPADR